MNPADFFADHLAETRVAIIVSNIAILVILVGLYLQGRKALHRLVELKAAKLITLEETEARAVELKATLEAFITEQTTHVKTVAETAATVAETAATAVGAVQTSLTDLTELAKQGQQLTRDAIAASAEAFSQANHVNEKLVRMASSGEPVRVEVTNNPLVTTATPSPEPGNRRSTDQ
jgi:hypothetical protein